MIGLIEEKRLAIGATMNEVERAADVSHGYYSRLLKGQIAKPGAALVRLKLGLARLSRDRSAGGGEEILVDLTYRFAVALIAARLDVDPTLVHAADPARRATQSPDWMKAARVRRLAVYVVNQYGGIAQVKVAKAAGLTKAAVCQAIKEIEDQREADGLGPELDAIGRAITGESW